MSPDHKGYPALPVLSDPLVPLVHRELLALSDLLAR
jgi:hypothetical protein